MTRSAILYLFLPLLIFGVISASPASAGPEPEQVSLMANEEYVGAIDHKDTRYLKITLINLTDEAATCRIAFYKERIELSDQRVGPAEFRTFTLEEKNARQMRIWTTLNFDEFTVNVETGNLQIIVEKTMYNQ
jgi:hypothetical protein